VANAINYKLFKGLFLDCKEEFLKEANQKAAIITLMPIFINML
jgi:hypothetical protein